MHCYSYDGSFEGLLTVIFYAYESKAFPAKIEKAGQEQPVLFGQHITIYTDEEKADRVWQGLGKKLTEAGRTNIYKAYLWEQPGFEMLIFRFVTLVFSSKVNIEENYTEDCVRQIAEISKQIFREKHRMEAFVRFKKTKDDLFVATISPDFNVLPLIKDHFEKRYADQKWLIYDLKRKYGIYYDLQKTVPICLENSEVNTQTGGISETILEENEVLYEALWQTYFHSVNIPERKNRKLHLRHIPVRYWKYLVEKQPRLR